MEENGNGTITRYIRGLGIIIQKTEKVENRFCYNGEMLDPVTQQYYLRARFYNPVIGRFTQEDTYYGDGLNLYQYCQANPVGYVDPSGHTCEIVQNYYEQYQEYRKQHAEATAAEAYEAVMGKNPLKKNPEGVTYEGPLYRNVGTLPDDGKFCCKEWIYRINCSFSKS